MSVRQGLAQQGRDNGTGGCAAYEALCPTPEAAVVRVHRHDPQSGQGLLASVSQGLAIGTGKSSAPGPEPFRRS